MLLRKPWQRRAQISWSRILILPIEDAVKRVEKFGRKALNVKVNVAEPNDTKAMAEQVLKEWGKIDILVNNAGITRDGLLLRMKEEDWNLVHRKSI